MLETFIPINLEANRTETIQDNIPKICGISWIVSWKNNFK